MKYNFELNFKNCCCIYILDTNGLYQEMYRYIFLFLSLMYYLFFGGVALCTVNQIIFWSVIAKMHMQITTPDSYIAMVLAFESFRKAFIYFADLPILFLPHIFLCISVFYLIALFKNFCFKPYTKLKWIISHRIEFL